MLQQMLDLYEIQKIDLGIRDVQKRLDEIPKDLRRLESQTGDLKHEVDKTRLERDALLREIKTLEDSVVMENQKHKKWESRLAEIRNQREYLALSREIEGGKRQNREAEEKVQELKKRQAELEKKLGDMQTQVSSQEGEATSERTKVDTDVNAVKEKLTSETQRRDELLPKIPRPLLAKYDSIRAKRLGIGIVPVIGGLCQGCNMRIPPQLFNILQRGQTVEQCPSCQRIIFWDKLLATGGTAAAPAS
ncbi:MAG: zinc ribbon domain-containing protein [Myxococcota bacterium]